jgi:hypothetical protein
MSEAVKRVTTLHRNPYECFSFSRHSWSGKLPATKKADRTFRSPTQDSSPDSFRKNRHPKQSQVSDNEVSIPDLS